MAQKPMSDREPLRSIPLSAITFRRQFVMTIAVGQPLDLWHRTAYDLGWYLLEIDADERPVRAYHRGLMQ